MSSVEWAAVCAAIGMALGMWAGRALGRPGKARDVPESALPPPEPLENALTLVARALPAGVVLVDRNRRVAFANAASATIFGFDAERALGVHVIQAVPNVEVERRIGDAMRGEASVAPIALGSRHERRVYRLSVYPLSDEAHESGEARWVVLFADDQTAMVRLDRARREFLSNVSHELRTPLASIKLMLETVAASPDDETASLFLPQVLAQVDRLVVLVGQLLEQARTESGQMELQLRDVDLESVAAPIVASFEPQASGKGVRLELLPIRPVRVEADSDRLAQVFVNLIDNALRHTSSGGRVKVEIDARESDAIVRIRDTGEGIPYRDLPHVFERFYVVDRSRTRESGGAGLGLAIVKGIVDAHGGSVSAESMRGRGTTFTVRLPIVRIRRSGAAGL